MIKNLLRYLEICLFYVDFNHSLGEVCVLSTRLISSSKETEIISFYIEIGQELFEIIGVQTHTQTDRQTHTRG